MSWATAHKWCWRNRQHKLDAGGENQVEIKCGQLSDLSWGLFGDCNFLCFFWFLFIFFELNSEVKGECRRQWRVQEQLDHRVYCFADAQTMGSRWR